MRYPLHGGRFAALVAILGMALISGAAALAVAGWSLGASKGDVRPRAAIVDQLAMTDPNPDFVAAATSTLEADGYIVDYYGRDVVTVDFYRTLPAHGYRLIVLRSHSSSLRTRDVDVVVGGESQRAKLLQPLVGLFTNEPYDKGRHVPEQLAHELSVSTYPDSSETGQYFGIFPSFITAMQGRFRGTTVILMGCAGLQTDDMAHAFIAKGASRFVSWDLPVTAEHTDRATERFLQHFAANGHDVSDAVVQTMIEVGPDPSFGARLLAYP